MNKIMDISDVIEMLKTKKDDNPRCGGMVNFASNIDPNADKNIQILQAFDYGFKMGYHSLYYELMELLKELFWNEIDFDGKK